jgi:hypothetical protein
MLELCSTLAATHHARALLLLLAQHKVHPGAAGSAPLSRLCALQLLLSLYTAS